MKKTMMNNIFKRFAALALCTGMVTGTALAANAVYKNIRVQYCGIKLVVDGQTVIPKDANGKVVEPFIYNGTTYLPVRAVGNAVDKKVKWDGNSKTVHLGATPDDVSAKKLTPYETDMTVLEQAGKSLVMMGKTYSQGLTDGNSRALYNLDGMYKSVEMDIGHIDGGWDNEGVVNFYVDGELVDTYDLTSEMQTQHIKVDLNRGLQLKIETKNYATTFYGLCNITFNK